MQNVLTFSALALIMELSSGELFRNLIMLLWCHLRAFMSLYSEEWSVRCDKGLCHWTATAESGYKTSWVWSIILCNFGDQRYQRKQADARFPDATCTNIAAPPTACTSRIIWHHKMTKQVQMPTNSIWPTCSTANKWICAKYNGMVYLCILLCNWKTNLKYVSHTLKLHS